MSFHGSDSWTILSPIEQSIKRKIEAIGTPLKDWDISINYGIKTGCNEAFIISGEKKDELVAADPKSAEVIRPLLRGKDIKRYSCKFADLWLLFIPWHFPLHLDTSISGASELAEKKFKAEYPAVYHHLLQYKPQLEKRNKAETGIRYEWYALQRWGAKYWDEFSKRKIVWGNLCLSAQFAYVESECFINAPSPMIVQGNKYLIAVLNSKLGDWYIRQLGVTRNGGYFEYKPMFVEKLPIPILSEEKQVPFDNVINGLLDEKKLGKDTTSIEEKVNHMVYDLYNLTQDEISFIEGI